MKIKYIVPPLYQRFFPSNFWNSDIQEIKATCDNCIQAPQKYEADLKCCTFWPFIPNYIVGKILTSKEIKYQSVQAVIRDHIQRRRFTLPIGLIAPSDFQVKFKKDKVKIFGKDGEFLCPYYSKKTNSCGVWLYRGSVCTSFFCASSFGKKGQTYWHQFENYLSYLEMGISQEVLAYKDFSPQDVNVQIDFLNVEEHKKLTLPTYKKIWKHFYGREEEFYIQSYDFVESMPKSQINEILGETGAVIQKTMIQSFENLGL